MFFKEEFKEDLHLTISKINDELKNNQRFVIVTDYKTILAIDTNTDDKLDIALTDLPKHYDFFLPWAGIEKAQHQNENPDIFGSMFQAVISANQRGSSGQHYTSVPNIMRVIGPLFLNDLYEEFEKAKETKKIETKIKKLKALKRRKNERTAKYYHLQYC